MNSLQSAYNDLKKFKAGLLRSHLDKDKPLTPYQAGQFSAQRQNQIRKAELEMDEGQKMEEWNIKRKGHDRVGMGKAR